MAHQDGQAAQLWFHSASEGVQEWSQGRPAVGTYSVMKWDVIERAEWEEAAVVSACLEEVEHGGYGAVRVGRVEDTQHQEERKAFLDVGVLAVHQVRTQTEGCPVGYRPVHASASQFPSPNPSSFASSLL